jgi:hypothetical protein
MATFGLNKIISGTNAAKGARGALLYIVLSSVSRSSVYLISKISTILHLSGSTRLAILILVSKLARAPHILVRRFRKI